MYADELIKNIREGAEVWETECLIPTYPVGVLNNGMNLLGFNTFVQKVALGLLLVIAVAISQYRVLRAETAHKSVKK